jgi:hypothetical protein
MQSELEGVVIVGVNQFNYASGNDSFTHGRDLPWLQEEEGDNVWETWMVTYRDVIIVDSDGYPVDVYNLTEHDLSESATYNELRDLLNGF